VREIIPHEDGLAALEYIAGWTGSWFPIRLSDWQPQTECIWRQGPQAGLAKVVRRLEDDGEVLIGLPQAQPCNGGVSSGTVLWARVEGTEQLARARRFRPLPSLVLAEGSSSRRWLLWSLSEPVGYTDLLAANRKVAYALKATQKFGDPDLAWLPAPGTRLGKTGSIPVRVARLTAEDWTVRQVTGRLKEPPSPDSWMDAACNRV
jgi:hypothetical protein